MITALVKKPKGKIDIYYEDEYFGTISEGACFLARLCVGQELDKFRLKDIIIESEKGDALSELLAALGRASITEKQGYTKLEAKEYSFDAIDYAIKRAKEYGYINDREYAKNYIESSIKSYGKIRIKHALIQKGIDSLLDEMIEGASEKESCIAALETMLRNKKVDLESYKEKSKVVRALLYKGYEYETVKEALAMIMIDLE